MTREEKVCMECNGAGACETLAVGNAAELMRRFFTPQGVEFCVKRGLPTMEVLLPFRGIEAEREGFYIEMPLKAKNRERIALFGTNARAELEYDGTGIAYVVVVMHGASAKIIARDYATVFVTNAGGTVETETTGNGKVFL